MALGIFLLFPALGAETRPATFADGFDAPQLDLARWIPHDPLSLASAGLTIGGGQLHIPPGGALSTFGIFAQTYGRFEIRAKPPAVKGLRARFRLMPIPLGTLPAIDVFEAPAPARIFFANRWGSEQTERSFGESFDLSPGFHTIALDWTHDHISWLLDGKEKFRSVDGIPHQPMYLLLDLTGAGPPTATLDVDYVSVYAAAP